MKQIIILLACVFTQANLSNAQYIYFNYSSLPSNEGEGKFFRKLFSTENHYFTLGNIDQNSIRGTAIGKFNLLGEPVDEFYYTVGYNYYGNGLGLSSESCIRMNNSNFVYLNTPLPCNYIFALVSINEDLDTNWTKRYDELLPDICFDQNFAWSIGELSNGNILALCERVYYNTSLIPDSTFKSYVEISSEDGSVVNYTENEKTYDTFLLGTNQIDGFRVLPGDTILHWGKTNHNPLNRPQQFIKKTDRYGNYIDSLQFGNPMLTQSGLSALELLEGDSGVYMYIDNIQQLSQTTYYIRPHLVFFKISTMEVLNEIEYTLPFLDNIELGGSNFNSIIQTQDHHIVAVLEWENVTTQAGSGIIKFDYQGNIIWANEYSPQDEQLIRRLSDIIEAPDGGYAAVGITSSTPSAPARHWLLKIDACGYEEPMGCPEVIVDGISEKTIIPSFVAWPNPFNLELKANLPDDAILVEWLDMSGRIIHTEQVFYPKQSFNLSKLADGNYMMRVVLQDGRTLSKRVVKY